jgi:hypothetical protein
MSGLALRFEVDEDDDKGQTEIDLALQVAPNDISSDRARLGKGLHGQTSAIVDSPPSYAL